MKRLWVSELDGDVAGIELCSDNPEFQPVNLAPGDASHRIIAEVVKALG